jgi:hypothetical protein
MNGVYTGVAILGSLTGMSRRCHRRAWGSTLGALAAAMDTAECGLVVVMRVLDVFVTVVIVENDIDELRGTQC